MNIKTMLALAIAVFSPCMVLHGQEITPQNYQRIKGMYNGEWSYPADSLASNVYARVRSVYVSDAAGESPFSYFMAVHGGINRDLLDRDMPKFLELASFVSNHCAEITADWRTYETNEMVRFTTLSAIGYSGYRNYTNSFDRLLGVAECDPASCGWRTVDFLASPYGTPMDCQLSLNFENSVSSNLVLRYKSLAIANSDTNAVRYCDEVLSGEWKRDHLIMEAAGAL